MRAQFPSRVYYEGMQELDRVYTKKRRRTLGCRSVFGLNCIAAALLNTGNPAKNAGPKNVNFLCLSKVQSEGGF